jgi:thiamine biosynthesis protein ThiS
MIKFFLNGKEFEISTEQTLEMFLKNQNLEKEKIAIEIDGEVIPKSSHNNFFIKPNMKIEIITFVGGG